MALTTKGPSFTLGGWAAVIALLGLFITVMTRQAISDFEQGNFELPIKYVLLCLCLVLMIGLREYYLKEVARESEEKYDQKFNDLVDILEHYPPIAAFRAFSTAYKKEVRTYRLENSVKSNTNREDTEKRIRYCLEALLQLFREYKYRDDAAIYSANIMTFISNRTYESKPELKIKIAKELRFIEDKNSPLKDLSGVLWLEKNLSATTKPGEELQVDRDLNDIILPVASPDREPTGPRSRFIPVAPLAVKENIMYVDDTQKLTTPRKTDEWEVSPSLKDELVNYFSNESSKRIGSILSIRLDYPVSAKDDTPMGVLNIHSNLPNTRLDRGHVESFISISRPMLERIKELIVHR